MRISVAVCTYNGERYLEEQLNSILGQTRAPDELVICDDASTDGTVGLAQEALRHATFPVRFVVNERNLGYSRNFERAISLCQGELIALSDQDDVWMPEKLAMFDRFFVRHTDVGLAFSDAQVVDEALRPLGHTVWEAVRFSRRERDEVRAGCAVRVLLRHNVVQGAGIAFRAALRPFLLPIPDGVVYDAWIAFLASAAGPISAIDSPLALYRLHGTNAMGLKTFSERLRGNRKDALQSATPELRLFERARERLVERRPDVVTARLREDLAHKVEHLRCRIGVVRGQPGWCRVMFAEVASRRYHRYSFGLLSIGHDLLRRWFNRGRIKRKGDEP